jgi:hypothetical protein
MVGSGDVVDMNKAVLVCPYITTHSSGTSLGSRCFGRRPDWQPKSLEKRLNHIG